MIRHMLKCLNYYFDYIRIGLEIVHVTFFLNQMALTILNDENTHNNITATITKDLTPCLVIVPFLTAIWGIQPSSITIIKRVDPITAPSLVRRRIKANVYCNQCYWHEFIIKAPCFAHPFQSVRFEIFSKRFKTASLFAILLLSKLCQN